MNERLITRSLQVFGVQVSGVALLFLVHAVLSRALGAYQYGIFAYVISWLTLLLTISMFGMREILVRYVASLRAQAQWSSLDNLLSFSRRMVFLNALGIAALMAVVVWCLGSAMEADMRGMFFIGALCLPIWGQFECLRLTLQGLKRATWSQFPDYVLRPGLLLGCFALLWVAGGQPTAKLAGYSLLGSLVLSVALVSAVLRHSLPKELPNVSADDSIPNWIATAFPFFVLAVLYVLMLNIDVLVLGLLRSPKEVGLFSAANKLAQVVGFGINAISVLLAPMLSEYYATQNLDDLQKALTRCARVIVAFTVPAVVGLTLVGEQLLALFGNEFSGAYQILLLLIAAQAVTALAGPVVLVLSMTEYERSAVRVYAVVSVLEIILCLGLVPLYGAEGAALSTLISTIVWCWALSRVMHTELRLDSSVRAVFRREK